MVDACGFLVLCCHFHGGFLGLTIILALPCHVLDSHGVVVFSTWFFCIGAHIPYGCGLEQKLWKAWNILG